MNKNLKSDYCVYRYTLIENGTVIYIGKTDSSLKQRIDAHEKEEKFVPYLGLWKIDYVELANNVETDIVEKFLINKLKPVLNEKDNVEGLIGISITLPEWIPYEKYESKKKREQDALLIAASKIAITNDLFFQKIYEAVLQNKTIFVSKEIHPTGMLPLPSGNAKVTELNVYQTLGGYANTILPYVREEIIRFPYRIQMTIWMPVAKLWKFNEKDAKQFDSLLKLNKFADILYEFRKNGFQESPDSERNILQIDADKELVRAYGELFCNITMDKGSRYAYVEINSEAYDKIPEILETIAKKFLILLKATGVISYSVE